MTKLIKQLPATRRNYRGKNMNGGRKVVFSRDRWYRNGATGLTTRWFGLSPNQEPVKRFGG